MFNIFKKKCKRHEFKRYEVISDAFTVIGYQYSDCIVCGKKWNRLNDKQQKESKYIDSGFVI